MLKHVYKAIVLTFAFFIAIFIFGRNIKEEKISFDTTVEMGQTSFPVMTVTTGENVINLLHGYGGSIDAAMIRESITPVDSSGSFIVNIIENETPIKKIKYEIRDTSDDKLIETNEVNVLNKSEDGKNAKIKPEAVLESGKEYAARITLIAKTGKKINYYTRLKVIEDDHLKEKIEFVMNFHNSILDKKKAEAVVKYLEPDYAGEEEGLAHVTIHSTFEQMSFGGLEPNVISDIIPTVKESHIETASIALSYVVSAKTDSGNELYNVKEFYRVRYTNERMYLLGYERFMESVFDVELTSLKKSEFKIGITNQADMEPVSSSDEKKMCFVRERELWYYDLNKNNAVKVFSFRQSDTDYVRDTYDQHNVRILNMDEEGNIDFLVYGYMNRGDYEGRVGITLYKFYSSQNRIEEQVYIPVEMPYQMLKENLNSFSYVSRDNVFYFSINDVVYAFNIITNSLQTIVSEVTSDSFIMSSEGRFIAWQNSAQLKESTEVTVLDLETGAKKLIVAPSGQNIKLLGNIGANFICGFGASRNIAETTDGRLVLPMSITQIVDKNGTVLKSYKKKGVFVAGANVEDNIVELERVKKTASGKLGYEMIKPDYILNNIIEKVKPIHLSERITQKAMSEHYISLPEGFVMKAKPVTGSTLNTIITKNSTLHLTDETLNQNKYYSYALDGIIGSFDNPADAIVLADKKMGTVLNGKQQIIWERSGKFTRSLIDGIDKINSGGSVSSSNACIRMLLDYNMIHLSGDEISAKDSIYTALRKHLKTEVLNLTGCNLDEVLYYVSKKCPVIAMIGSNDAVLITGYDEFNVTYLDPSTGYFMKKGLSDGDKLFEKAGNIFIGYIGN